MKVKVSKDKAGLHIFLDRARVLKARDLAHKASCDCKDCMAKRKANDATYFSQGQKVTALQTVQGLTKGQEYKVTSASSRSMPMAGQIVIYGVMGIDGREHKISNGHLLLKKTGDNKSVKDASVTIEYKMGNNTKPMKKLFASAATAEAWELAQSTDYKRVSYVIKNDQNLLPLLNNKTKFIKDAIWRVTANVISMGEGPSEKQTVTVSASNEIDAEHKAEIKWNERGFELKNIVACAKAPGQEDKKTVKDSNYTGGGAKFKAAKAELGALGISLVDNKEWEEYIVAGSYHTDDLDDAIGTGKVMAKKRGVKGAKDSNYTGGGAKFKAAKAELGALGISLADNKEWEEYIVAGSYHTDDLDDAIGTGKLMAKKRGAKDNKPCTCKQKH